MMADDRNPPQDQSPVSAEDSRPVERSEEVAHSFEVSDILGKPPSWILRWGNIILAVFIAVIALVCVLVRYPDVVSGQMKISGDVPALDAVALRAGHLKNLLVQNHDHVTEGQTIGIIETTAEAERVFQVKKVVSELLPMLKEPEKLRPIDLPPELKLGELQGFYSTCQEALRNFQRHRNDTHVKKTVKNLRRQLSERERSLRENTRQIQLSNQSLVISKSQFDRVTRLMKLGSLSKAEHQTQENQYLTKQSEHADLLRRHSEEQTLKLQLEQKIDDLEKQYADTTKELISSLRSSVKNLYSEIEKWEEQVTIKAPADGTVEFFDVWSQGQYIDAGSRVFTVVSETEQVTGRLSVSGQGVGKIKVGQQVNIKFPEYDYKEFGVIAGTVKAIDFIPSQGTYLVEVDLTFPLVTTYDREIPFSQSLIANGEVVTEDVSLLSRIFYHLRSAIESSSGN